jgi:hypothetical protein
MSDKDRYIEFLERTGKLPKLIEAAELSDHDELDDDLEVEDSDIDDATLAEPEETTDHGPAFVRALMKAV